MISFRVDGRSGVAPYLQIVRQVRQALRMGVLNIGDQLPSVREVVASVAINPNTVLKAYRDLEREGLIEARAGQGTFVRAIPAGPPPGTHSRLGRSPARRGPGAWPARQWNPCCASRCGRPPTPSRRTSDERAGDTA